MNFFEHQDQARRATRRLVLLFCLAVLTLIVLTTGLVYGLFFYLDASSGGALGREVVLSEVFLYVSLAVTGVVLLASLFRLAQLRGGGETVAESMGGRILNLNTRDPDERRVLNVVEEMAIASGVPVPPVYLLEDPAINAFAAGYRPDDAVIGVTRGCIRNLTRDELQGVVAHEFSHVLHGDMRLNLRLIGVLYGIMVLGLLGYHLLRGGLLSRGRRSRNGGGLVALGLGLVVIGYGGTFFGGLIKSAVSRQREFLADASAVQFTRNPDGIAGALSKIGGYGSRLYSVDAAEISHMLIGEGGKPAFIGLFSTHPPIETRIRRIHPGWSGETAPPPGEHSPETEEAVASAGSGSGQGLAGLVGAVALLDRVGNPDAGDVEQAQLELSRIPESYREALHDPYGARAVMESLVIAASPTGLHEQLLASLETSDAQTSGPDVRALLPELQALVEHISPLTLVELAIPALRQLSPAQRKDFMMRMMKLIAADGEVTLLEWCLYRLVKSGLEGGDGRRGRGARRLSALTRDCERLLSVLACAGQSGESGRRQAFAQAVTELGLSGLELREEERIDIRALDRAVTRLMQLHPLQKPRLLKAMVQCCLADGRIRRSEAELLRVTAAVLDCPMPPLTERDGVLPGGTGPA